MVGYIEINVSRAGKHYFATAPRSMRETDLDKLRILYADFLRRFPKDEGFAISVTRWQGSGTRLDHTFILG